MLERIKRHKALLLALGLTLAGSWAAVSGPRGLKVLIEKRQEIRRLQEENAALEAENANRSARIKWLEESKAEQEIEIRKQLHLQRENETTFILPEPTKPDDKEDKKGEASK